MPRDVSLSGAKRRKDAGAADRLLRPAAGLEAEFALVLDDRPATPEAVFGDPRGFLDVPLLHRTGRSYHLPTGAAVYFDTGVIELATPPMELARGCFTRLALLLDDSLALLRRELDRWEARTGHRVRLQGFSAHYNVSPGASMPHAPDRVAWLLAHILPAPVMLLAANPLSTGVGVRPRPPRLEVTVDFSPDALRTAATGALIGGIVVAVSRWPSVDVSSLDERRIPVVKGFAPMAHTTRHGWLARYDCYPESPFACDPDHRVWDTTQGVMSLREIARRVWDAFKPSIRTLADPFSYAAGRDIIDGSAASWLGASGRPSGYDDLGRSMRRLRTDGVRRSRYEQVVVNAIRRIPLELDDGRWIPDSVVGWTRVMFRRTDGRRRAMTLDALVEHLDRWHP